MKPLSFLVTIILFSQLSGQSGIESWRNLIPLESNRRDVEKILGSPETYFVGFGTYRTDIGKFSIWYSKGRCQNDSGMQWDVPEKKLTRLLVHLSHPQPLESYVSNVKELRKTESPGGYSRNLYTSPDESVVFETIVRKDHTEFVYTVELLPSKSQQRFLCSKPS